MRRFPLLPVIAAVIGLPPSLAGAQETPARQDDQVCVLDRCPGLGRINTWTARQVISLNAPKIPSPRNGAGLYVVGADPSGENNGVDVVALNGAAQVTVERYNLDGYRFMPVRANEAIGGFFAAAFDGRSNAADAGVFMYTTETQDHASGRNGMGLWLTHTPNGSTALSVGLAVSPQGKGGVTVWGGYASNDPVEYKGPADLGPGTLNAADSITTANHLRTSGGHGSISSCGSNPAFITGTDQAGQIATGGAVSSCTYSYAKAWDGAAICMVQVFNAPTPTAYLSRQSATAFTVAFSAPFNGTFQYLCMGVPSA